VPSLQQFERRFNAKHRYPLLFINDKPFTRRFVNATRALTRAPAFYGIVPREWWSYPPSINQVRGDGRCGMRALYEALALT
jgi:alpha 1,2-mannosyltransferase